MERASGILLHISSLPSNYGIGTLGEEAYKFARFLNSTGQKYWQMLPLGHTSYGDSPYQCFSSSAGNPYFIDLDMLVEQNLLTVEEIQQINMGDDSAKIDYERLYTGRYKLLRKAFDRDTLGEDFEKFRSENSDWVEYYAEFMAIKAYFNMKSWQSWDEGIKLRQPFYTWLYRRILKTEIDFYVYIQYLFFAQWEKLKKYANSLGIKIIGDVPIYVAMDSAESYNRPELFKFDKDKKPTKIAGVPPDYFSENGQLWGNPIYDWDYMAKDGYRWWIGRMKSAAKLFDVIRIDHFRGFESYFEIDPEETTAKNGKWQKGPGMQLLNLFNDNLKDTEIIAEDLGILTPEVEEMVEKSGYPGMKILQFAFDGNIKNAYLPHSYNENCVVYTGTHDNTTTADWLVTASDNEIELARQYCGFSADEGWIDGLIRTAFMSRAKLVIIPMQDYLNLGGFARINTPSTLGGNWDWRLDKNYINDQLQKKIEKYPYLYGR